VLNLVDLSLETFLRAEVPLSGDQIDISFDAPDDDWGARRTKPTVNLFLWDVRMNLRDRESGIDTWTDDSGRLRRGAPKPRVNLRYLVTAWTTEPRDEHQLLGAMLAAFYQHVDFPVEHLHKDIAKVRPVPQMAVALPDGVENADFWTALGGRLKPGLDLIVTVTLDVVLAHEVGPPVFEYTFEVADKTGGAHDEFVLIGDPETRAIARGGKIPDDGERAKEPTKPRKR